MSKSRVVVAGMASPPKSVDIETDATKGATLGVDIYYNGALLDPRQVLNYYAPRGPGSTTFNVSGGGGGPSGDLTTDDVAEGSRKYFSDERAQDAVGGIMADTAEIDFTYVDEPTPAISALLKTTTVVAGSYGDATHIATFTVDSKGRLTAAGQVSIAAAGSVSEIRKIVALRAY